jgi:hypothetical protein
LGRQMRKLRQRLLQCQLTVRAVHGFGYVLLADEEDAREPTPGRSNRSPCAPVGSSIGPTGRHIYPTNTDISGQVRTRISHADTYIGHS